MNLIKNNLGYFSMLMAVVGFGSGPPFVKLALEEFYVIFLVRILSVASFLMIWIGLERLYKISAIIMPKNTLTCKLTLMKLYIRFAICFLVLMTLNSCGELSETRVVRLGHGLDVSHSVHKAMVKMGEDLEKISGGKMKLEIYPSQQLGTERQCLELLQIGSLDMTKVSVGTLENFAPKMKVLGLEPMFPELYGR